MVFTGFKFQFEFGEDFDGVAHIFEGVHSRRYKAEHDHILGYYWIYHNAAEYVVIFPQVHCDIGGFAQASFQEHRSDWRIGDADIESGFAQPALQGPGNGPELLFCARARCASFRGV
jgi:hypothetical protein